MYEAFHSEHETNTAGKNLRTDKCSDWFLTFIPERHIFSGGRETEQRGLGGYACKCAFLDDRYGCELYLALDVITGPCRTQETPKQVVNIRNNAQTLYVSCHCLMAKRDDFPRDSMCSTLPIRSKLLRSERLPSTTVMN